ncbi:MAG: hypothetical protein NZ805_01025 [Armatimonadetes bacterium]|nr:hypothetical protein [Armatimonadota bacterium]MDW8028361.1 hypothetical protein [Armatimonadota bacterium]
MRLSKRFDKTITIPVKIRDGKATFLYGDQLPPLRDGTEGKLVVPEYAISDIRWFDLLSLPVIVQMLPAKTTVSVMMKFDRVLDAKELGWLEDEIKQAQAFTFKPHTGEIAKEWEIVRLGPVFIKGVCLRPRLWGKRVRNPYGYFLVKVLLQEPLRLEMRGTSSPRLLDCRCHIPALEKHEKQFAASLNEAYTRVSEVFEPTRRSHTGNIFLLCVVKLPMGWLLLDNLRSLCKAEYGLWLIEQLSKIEKMPTLGECQKEIALRIQKRLEKLFKQPL